MVTIEAFKKEIFIAYLTKLRRKTQKPPGNRMKQEKTAGQTAKKGREYKEHANSNRVVLNLNKEDATRVLSIMDQAAVNKAIYGEKSETYARIAARINKTLNKQNSKEMN